MIKVVYHEKRQNICKLQLIKLLVEQKNPYTYRQKKEIAFAG